MTRDEYGDMIIGKSEVSSFVLADDFEDFMQTKVNPPILEAVEAYRLAEEEGMKKPVHPMDTQVGGDHYKDYVIQPLEFITKNNIPFIEGNIIKYITRWKDKNGVEDLKKVIHYTQLLAQLEGLNLDG
tara:strand:+ start:1491 stop:1874 length:384 start_codon:yes stop_codon:yes gene_type:complete